MKTLLIIITTGISLNSYALNPHSDLLNRGSNSEHIANEQTNTGMAARCARSLSKISKNEDMGNFQRGAFSIEGVRNGQRSLFIKKGKETRVVNLNTLKKYKGVNTVDVDGSTFLIINKGGRFTVYDEKMANQKGINTNNSTTKIPSALISQAEMKNVTNALADKAIKELRSITKKIASGKESGSILLNLAIMDCKKFVQKERLATENNILNKIVQNDKTNLGIKEEVVSERSPAAAENKSTQK